ncbi:endonuclease/exonuclease/phosphatase family protein [Pseudomaricurvus alcaniphilus]|uniref:endonuclease/exonuclease/phosphatase family protein n=1 Tax=Pseudomaricurvus alcaniphilus TaxID=1166482 RepID=UPI001A9FEEF3
MKPITFLYMENTIRRRRKSVQQQLTFFMSVENVGYHKAVDVLWAGEDNQWRTLGATHHSAHGQQHEYWSAGVSIKLSSKQALPGNIRFSLRYRVGEHDHWDNNHGKDYHSDADSGILLGHSAVQNILCDTHFAEGAKYVPVKVAVDSRQGADRVVLHWTTDDWTTRRTTDCSARLNLWDKLHASNARNPNQYGVQVWAGIIRCRDAFRLQYSICYHRGEQTYWDNNAGQNYILQRDPLRVMILNLHCYQEKNQAAKLRQIARAIAELDVDIACLQEVAENWNDGHGDWQSNAARIINEHLPQPYYLHTDWSHLGFERYREGIAILSRYPFLEQQSRYVSDDQDIYSIHARKVVMGAIKAPYIGLVNVYSAHLSWLQDGFEEQFNRLHDWAAGNHGKDVQATLLCGDFNVTVDSAGYQLVVNSKQYDDQFMDVNQHGLFEKIFRAEDPYWQDLSREEYRIDYIFMNRGGKLRATSAEVIFTEADYGRVSDHCGYVMTFEPQP